MRRMTVVVVALAVLPMLAGGCVKKVQLTIMNHGDTAREIQVTTPEETTTLGSVGPNEGQLTGLVAIKTSDFPAQVRLSAGGGATTSFMVTEDTADRLWFHISRSGAMAGPYGKQDVHVETEKDAEVTVKSEGKMVVK
ncbi:MAG: hypothetical protein MUP47_05455 [Phycisphaerae bacterium]|nr:hypothetical protein [Phycisphaerae bacterium]